ncbi:hypothetical protein FOZ63_011144 [Perkinsus olseni]|uniref:Secreted protein n=1 Tax=Perkinsus olseni TaxID=32597 RepID=A0A7J6Q6E6_PEROL|nr:hypothetical protein FOZ62_022479 [Perkinsus olseni]KAF4719073.1 hypothetical protein FOZ63_011144 [Perkinsus olseni]
MVARGGCWSATAVVVMEVEVVLGAASSDEVSATAGRQSCRAFSEVSDCMVLVREHVVSVPPLNTADGIGLAAIFHGICIR